MTFPDTARTCPPDTARTAAFQAFQVAESAGPEAQEQAARDLFTQLAAGLVQAGVNPPDPAELEVCAAGSESIELVDVESGWGWTYFPDGSILQDPEHQG
jgi:hypothetical protein